MNLTTYLRPVIAKQYALCCVPALSRCIARGMCSILLVLIIVKSIPRYEPLRLGKSVDPASSLLLPVYAPVFPGERTVLSITEKLHVNVCCDDVADDD